ncbi:unnamed protein product [Ambrosiozyma monospora]|uniref:Unnamed protein product n=1 Tax=Ambrosiozyma monospora TaxID=43982 RepID=A0A9W7DGG6_AMBMO|nr:unnamed protein product [Ambrosiozyma monospora]
MNGIKETNFDSSAFKLNPFENITEELIHQRTLLMEQQQQQKIGRSKQSNIRSSAESQDKLQNEKDEVELSQSFTGSLFNACLNTTTKILRHIPLAKHVIGPPNETAATINKLIAQQKAATSYTEWYETSIQLDQLCGNNKWKETPESQLFDYELVSTRLEELRSARLEKDYHKLLYLIRTTWTRNMANMDNINLYRHSSVGTKVLVEEFISECETCLKLFASGQTGLDDGYVLGMLMQTRKNYGRVAITMSGGGCFGLLEIGVFATLLEMDLLPKIVSGSSSGSIFSSIMCAKTTPEVLELLSTLADRQFEIFEKDDTPETTVSCLARLLKYGTWFENTHLQTTMKDFLGDLTFREAYNRTGRILNITVSPASVFDQPTLLNYLTAPNVLIWSAVCASCSLPGVFPSSTIYEKQPPTGLIQEWSTQEIKFVDGSVNGDLPITRLSEMFNVNHVIAVQVNPHVAPLLKMSIECVGGEVENEYSAKLKQLLHHGYNLVTTEAMHYLEVLSEIGIATNICTKLKQVLSQQYSGDITILPDIRLTELNKLLANPTPEFIWDCIVRGARATWPKVSIIKNHCSVEFCLDKSITAIRSRIVADRQV